MEAAHERWIENDPGILGDSWNRSRAAEKAFKTPVSSGLATSPAEPDLHPAFLKRFPSFTLPAYATWADLFDDTVHADKEGMLRVWVAYDTHGAIGCTPFGVDTADPTRTPITRVFELLSFNKTPDAQLVTRFGDFELLIQRVFVFGKLGSGGGMVIHKGDGQFLLISYGVQVTFKSTNPSSVFTSILQCVEKVVKRGWTLEDGRYSNRDETRGDSFAIMTNNDHDDGDFGTPVTIPVRTFTAERPAYSIG
ncbi:hypothetical protein EDB81DRAFT_875860 [Dactylonectria macrodidyma]|uniref:DUF5597 domain-containing protein n=1 Tax=Dactylonectria macrodidyma TaxID=307937 RepID=A0A9P9JJU6_9HYPO|nr:hypothetical protein EDB81DRAFT_875860 [Dactylonectria macrodidyma]